jgi:hypothetical protein
MIDGKAHLLDLTIAGRDFTIHQSPSLLRSNLPGGTTGAVVWDITPVFAEWLGSSANILFKHGILSSSSIVLELGSGIAGIVGLMLAPLIKRFVFTDQEYVLKLLRQNIEDNTVLPSRQKTTQKKIKGAKEVPSRTEVLALDWEVSVLDQLPQVLESVTGVDVVLAVDCVFNESLVEPIVKTCEGIVALREEWTDIAPTVCIFAQQLRQPDVFELWLRTMMRHFTVWRVPEDMLSRDLAERSGFVVHVAVLREMHSGHGA